MHWLQKITYLKITEHAWRLALFTLHWFNFICLKFLATHTLDFNQTSKALSVFSYSMYSVLDNFCSKLFCFFDFIHYTPHQLKHRNIRNLDLANICTASKTSTWFIFNCSTALAIPLKRTSRIMSFFKSVLSYLCYRLCRCYNSDNNILLLCKSSSVDTA
jgi:hypothetical protein